MMKESVERVEERMIKEKSNVEEMVQNRPIEETQKERIQQRVECDKVNKWNAMERDGKRENGKRDQYNAE